MNVKYQANDGTLFDTAEDCIEYENTPKLIEITTNSSTSEKYGFVNLSLARQIYKKLYSGETLYLKHDVFGSFKFWMNQQQNIINVQKLVGDRYIDIFDDVPTTIHLHDGTFVNVYKYAGSITESTIDHFIMWGLGTFYYEKI